MATEKQRAAARRNIRKAQAAWQAMSHRQHARAQPEGRARKKPGTGEGGDYYHVRVRPTLRDIAAHRLQRRYGVDLDGEAARARELVPSEAWEIVRPDRPMPADRLARGPSLEEQRIVLEELERL